MGRVIRALKLFVFGGVLLALVGIGEIALAILGSLVRPPTNEPIADADYDDIGVDIDD